MIQGVKDFVRTKEHLYDILKLLKRRILPESDPVYEFFDTFSKSHNRNIAFIQIGANDGLRNDPVREFIVRDRWRGILVEPVPSVFDMLQNNYAYLSNPELKFINAAISSSNNDNLTFYTFDDIFLKSLPLEKSLDCLRKASFDRRHVEKHINNINEDYSKVMKAIKVPALTVNSLVNKYWTEKKIDILVIDAEGHEPDIIKCIDFKTFFPEAIFFESHNLGAEKGTLFEFLYANGYAITEIGGDAVAIAHPR